MKAARWLAILGISLVSAGAGGAATKFILGSDEERFADVMEHEFGFSRVAAALDKGLEGKTIEDPDDKFYYYVLARKTDELTAGLTSERDKAVAIAQWIGTSWRNSSTEPLIHKSHGSRSMLDKLLFRTGACGTRAGVFVYMAELAGLEAKRFSIFNFGGVGNGHTAAQVYYEGDWHFFDVTYSGYFEKDGDILSFDEIRRAGADAVHYLVPFASFGDVVRRTRNQTAWEAVDNRRRMTHVYSAERLAKAQSAGFVGDDQPVTLTFAVKPGLQLGSKDGRSADTEREGRSKKVSEQLGRMGFPNVPFYYAIKLKELAPGQAYRYRLVLAENRLHEAGAFKVGVEGCRLRSGETFDPKSGDSVWDIELMADRQRECSMSITHDVRDRGRYVHIDAISFEPSAPADGSAARDD